MRCFGCWSCSLHTVCIGRGYDDHQLFKVILPLQLHCLSHRIALANDEKRYLERSAKILIGILICVYALSFAPALLYLDIKTFVDGSEELGMTTTIKRKGYCSFSC